MITIQLTEAQAARVCYAMEREASEHHQRMRGERENGSLSAASGRLEIIHENGRDECMSVVRLVEAAIS